MVAGALILVFIDFLRVPGDVHLIRVFPAAIRPAAALRTLPRVQAP